VYSLYYDEALVVSGAQSHASPQSHSVPQAHWAGALLFDTQEHVSGVQVQGWQLHSVIGTSWFPVTND